MGILDAPVILDVRSKAQPYDSKTTSTLLPFRTALASRASRPCNILVVGDSTDEGTGVGTTATLRSQSWPDRLAAALRARFPTSGETSSAPNWSAARTDSSLLTPWTVSGGWVAASNFGPGAYGYRSSTAGSTLVYAIAIGVTSVDIMFVGGTSISGFNYKVDAGAASGTITGTGTTSDGQVQRVTGWDPSSTHTLTITSVGSNCYVDGVIAYTGNESAGIRVFNTGHHGSKIQGFLNGGLYNWLPATPAPGTLSGVQSVIPMNPDLVIQAWGYNDFNNGSISPAQFVTNNQTMAAAIRAMLPAKTIPFVYLVKWVPGASWTSSTAATWNDFREAMRTVAAADPYGVFLDLGASSYQPQAAATTAAFPNLYADAVHGKASAYQSVADQVANFLAA